MHPLMCILLVIVGVALTVGLIVYVGGKIHDAYTRRVPTIVELSENLYAIELRYAFGKFGDMTYLGKYGSKITKVRSQKQLENDRGLFTDVKSIEEALRAFQPPTLTGKVRTLNELKTEELIDG